MANSRPGELLSAGTKIGPYEVVAFVDQGGMGEVYRARDVRLNRDVALKILPREFSEDPGRQERFRREAWVLASLNHPHVSAIYDVGEYGGRTFLVMEFVEGESLRARLAKRTLPPSSVAILGAQIASALDAAHRRGFVHRDLKPGNIMVTSSGVKLLDFGVAKLLTEPVSPADQLENTTASDAAAVPGTTPYSAPEQLDGRPVDARADVFALGVVLFEMLTGRRPFRADSKAGLIAAILEKPPEPLGLSSGEVPMDLERAIFKCLEKDPDLRWQSVRDLSTQLDWISQNANRPQSPVPPRSFKGAALPAVAFAVTALAIAVGFWWSSRNSQGVLASPVFRFTVTPPTGFVMSGTRPFAISPDGRRIAFVGSFEGGPSLLWIRALDSYSANPIPGTDNAWHPFWSPDNTRVAFLAGSKLKTADISNGAVLTLADIPGASKASQGAWGDRELLIAAGPSVYRVPESGGAPAPLRVMSGERQPRVFSLRFLPGGRDFLFRGPTDGETGSNIYVASVDGGAAVPLLRADSQVDYVDPGYLLFMRGTDLLFQGFDARARQLNGHPLHVPETVSRSTRLSSAVFSTSRSGVLAYEADAIVTQLVWHDRLGRRLGTLGEPGLYTNPAITGDGSRALVTKVDPSTGGSDIWVIDQDRGSRPLTSSPGAEDYALWAPHGRSVIFASDRSGAMRMYEKPSAAPADRLEDDSLVTDAIGRREDNWPMDWSASGRTVLFQGGGGGPGIPPLLFSIDRGRTNEKPVALFPEGAWRGDIQEAAQAKLSPDERWLAYVTDIGGSPQVYVRSFSDRKRVWQVSTTGGYEPKWRGDGQELFFLSPNRSVVALSVSCAADCVFGKPTTLFSVPGLGAPLRKGSVRNEYDVTADGQRFLINEPMEGPAAYSIRVVLNWFNGPGR